MGGYAEEVRFYYGGASPAGGEGFQREVVRSAAVRDIFRERGAVGERGGLFRL